VTPPRSHNLISFLPLLTPHHPSLASLRRGLDYLTRFAVDVRYPGDSPTKRQSAAAVRWMNEVRTVVRVLLGLPTTRPRRKR
jgi:hypothetical protein